MLKAIKDKVKNRENWFLFNRQSREDNLAPVLRRLRKELERELNFRLSQLKTDLDDFLVTIALHTATDNLSDVKSAVRQMLRKRESFTSEAVLNLLDEQIAKTEAVLKTEPVSGSSQATEIGVRTLNLLFVARQRVKQKFSIITLVNLPPSQNGNLTGREQQLPVSGNNVTSPPRILISSTLLYQLHHSLFPAERMLVCAGFKKGETIEIDGVFDVTGKATSGYVKADAARLARALIAMSETDRYFALWVHSHPGTGGGMTYPSSTDLNQEAEWLKDYSSNLVNAIMVEDRFVRFWGKALDEERVTVKINGAGVRRESETEHLYRLEF
ncbi:MAG: hypothetical protein M3209_01030 [Acidobacteriota bacterium]|nr:hypothetical protein [Acidobacteriota bacterium]